MLKVETLLAVAVAALLPVLALTALPGYAKMVLPGDAERGALLYESRCIGCHSLTANRVGPRHDDVFGREIGSLDDFDYSPALARATAAWDAAALDAWLANPEAFLPGQRMNFRVAEVRDRRDLIAFLQQQVQD